MAQEFTQANRKFFNEFAASYDTKPWQQKVSAQMSDFIRSNLDFIGVAWASEGDTDGRQVRLLDYACGTGSATRAFLPYVTRTIGIDLASSMVAKYNELARASNLPKKVAHAVVGDLLSNDPSELPRPAMEDEITEEDLHNFDIAAVSAGFHHFHNQELAISRMAERLKPGGIILILDWARDDDRPWNNGQPFPAQHTVKSHGFSETRMRELFEGQGLVDVGYKIMSEPVVLRMNELNPMEVKVFLGRARKP